MHKALYLILLFSATAFGQGAPAKINAHIQSTKTSKHINIPGTRVYIIPPPDFTVAEAFVGLTKNGQSVFNIYDLPGGSFYTNAATFSREKFEGQGIHVFSYEELKVNSYPAKFIVMQGRQSTKTFGLVFGDATFSTMIIAAYPESDDATGKQIIASLNSIYYDKSRKVDPFETARFSLDDKNSKFKFLQFSANVYTYTVGGVDVTVGSNEPFAVVTQMPADPGTDPSEIAKLMMSNLQNKGFTNAEITNASTNQINGYKAYEAAVYGQMSGKKAVIYECVVTDGNKAIAIQGIATSDFENNVQEFKKLAHTIRFK